MKFLPRAEVLTLEELQRLACAFIDRGVHKIRLTGGEPLVRRDVIRLVEGLGRELGGSLKELTLTTNGLQLADVAGALADAGVRRVNVSLDTLDPELFKSLSRRDGLSRVLEGIAAASAAGLAVKVNVVALRGANEREIPDLVAWAHGQGHAITLIEVMPMGDVGADRYGQHLPLDLVRRRLEERWTLIPTVETTGGPARYFDISETGGRIGFITPLTSNFCSGCNRVRVTATGQLYGCLGGSGRVDLRDALRSGDPRILSDAMDQAMLRKQQRHHFVVARSGSSAVDRHMSTTGG